MTTLLHLTSGDNAGERLARSGLPGEVFVWHDLLYDGPRNPGWPDEATLQARTAYLYQATGGGLSRTQIHTTLTAQYARLAAVDQTTNVVLWFDACLFDQAMLAHVLTCLGLRAHTCVELLCLDAFPGIEPFHGLGQLSPEQLASVWDQRHPVTPEQWAFAAQVDRAFALQDRATFEALAAINRAPLPWVPAAVARWLQEQPDCPTGLGRLERLALAAVRSGATTPHAILQQVSEHDTPPQFWGDIALWAKLNTLAERIPPLITITGPQPRLPQWEGLADLTQFRIFPTS